MISASWGSSLRGLCWGIGTPNPDPLGGPVLVRRISRFVIRHRGGGGAWTAKTVNRPPQQPAQPPIHQLPGAADTQTAHHTTFSTAPAHQRLGSANAETTPAGAPAAAADRTQRPDATCEGKNGCPGPRKGTSTRRNVTQGGCQAPHPAEEVTEGDGTGSADACGHRVGASGTAPLGPPAACPDARSQGR